MKKSILLTLLFAVLLLLSCEEDAPEVVDPREAIAGNYEMNVLTGGTFDSDFNVQSSPIIEVSYEDSFDDDEIYLDLEAFVEAILEELTLMQFNTRDILRAQISRDELLATVEGDLIELEDVEFLTLYTSAVNEDDILVCELNLSGKIDGSAISFDFDLYAIGENISYYAEGSTSGSAIQ